MKKLVVAFLSCMIIFSIAAAGCGGSKPAPATPAAGTPAAAPAAKKPYTIAVIVKDSTTPFWRYLITGAKNAGKDLGSNVIEYAPLQTQNLEEQVRQVEDAIQKGVSAICIAPIDANGIIPAIEKANKAGIPVITTNSKSNGGKIETFIGVDNYAAAKVLAQYMMDKINGTGNVVIIEGNPAGQTSVDRVKGFKEVIAKYPNVKLLVSQPAMFSRDQAMSVMENIIQSNKNITAVMALNDEMALGSRQALDGAGMTNVMITGFDGAKEGLEAILAGKMYASLNQAPHAQGYDAVKAAVDILNGKKVEPWIKVGGQVCDKSNSAELLKNYK